MQFEGRRRTSSIPNLTPLIDIVFLLLIFFMLTSHFVRDEVLDIELPEADSAQALDEPEQVEIVIAANGEYSIAGQVIAIDDLQSLLSQRLLEQKEKVVRIRGDKSVSLGTAIDAFDAARKAGASGIDIVTIKQPPKQAK